ncbi:hypothetical protein NK718_10380 [Alsobacter sp. SYSU M60028]|uniref:Uncharacterized protein n=1 Tax=Alsobacter ponti TaxID=2962936 RepID=A0ABT1LBR0_9HYPH|nr:DUF6600 domain-containing protein [Alsobacter ponti]MCP8938922.1 hypothetical protein [Alsobacter ponti]
MKRSDFMTGAAVAALLLATPLALATSADAQSARRHMQPMHSDSRGMPSDARMHSDSSSMRSSTTTTTRETVSVEQLRTKLEPEGEFVRVSKLGEAWRPRDVERDWQPYTNGRWIFNQQVGWYFESDEPWAEITYHYGRWYDDPEQGWVWIAGTEWAPAWVEWRRNKDYVGWRPLPPSNAPRRVATRRGDRGYDVTEIQEEWVFVPTREITTERITTVRIEPSRVVEVYRDARPIGSVERRGSYAVNFALQPQVLEREANIRIESRNIPRAEAAPVPQPVRAIATEERTTTSTTSTRRDGQDNRPAASDTEQRPGQPPRPGQARGTEPNDRPAAADAQKKGEDASKRMGQDTSPGAKRPDATGAVKRPGEQDNQAAKPDDQSKGKTATDSTKPDDQSKGKAAMDSAKPDDKSKGKAATDSTKRLPANANAGGEDRGQNRAEQRRPANAAAGEDNAKSNRSTAEQQQRRLPANANAGGQDRGQNRAEERRSPAGAANANAGGEDRGQNRAEQRRPEQAGQARRPMPDTTGSTRPAGRSGESPAMQRGGEQGGPAAAGGAQRPRPDAGPAQKRKLPDQGGAE